MNKWLIIAAGLFVLVALGGGAYMVASSRGFRNNNPGNLIYVPSITWRGQIGYDPDGYLMFDTMENGVRAMAKDLLTGFRRDDENTVREIITEYAPSHENPTAAYIEHVSRALDVHPDTVLSESRLPELVRAIVYFENGSHLADTVINEGVRLAYA